MASTQFITVPIYKTISKESSKVGTTNPGPRKLNVFRSGLSLSSGLRRTETTHDLVNADVVRQRICFGSQTRRVRRQISGKSSCHARVGSRLGLHLTTRPKPPS